ncbi:putative exported protein [Janthinobacterium sp. CG23_2]|nr:putative exported protein [Janthinobacterium sp. CG23_2]CUU28231.1 putative exported protein [Janthinobacterium sp. CG23_2]
MLVIHLEKIMSLKKIALIAALTLATQAHAQTQLATAGAMVIVPAYGEVTHPNDQVVATFFIEEQDKDKAAAASRVNQKMKQGTEIVRREDPKAILKTVGYYTYPIYPEVVPRPDGQPQPRPLVPTGWRVGQYLEVKTTNLANLPKMTAAVQKILALNGLNFGLSPDTTRKLDAQRLIATYKNLNERVAAIASAMGRTLAEAVVDTVDFEGSGNYGGQQDSAPMLMRAAKAESTEVAEPSFEPGETTLQMRLVGKVKFR